MKSVKKISIKACSLSTALVMSLILGLLALVSLSGPGSEVVVLLSSLLAGYEASGSGIFVGLIWGFLLGGISGYFFGWLYNKML